MRTKLVLIAVLILAAAAGTWGQQSGPAAVLTTPPFETYLELLRRQAGIPGLSAAIVQDGELVWARGFGFQDQEQRIAASPETPYPVAGLSAALGATLVLQCVEGRLLDLDAPAATYGVALPEPGATLRHVLTHTSAGIPGAAFQYDPARYSQLTPAVERCTSLPYRKAVAVRLLDYLAMVDSVPGRDLQNREQVPPDLFTPEALDRYARVLERMAVPYRIDGRRAVRAEMPPLDGINAATGLVSTVRDLARFEAALQADVAPLLLPSTLAAAWTNVIGQDRLALPTGLGWFVQRVDNQTVVWQFGIIPGAYSSLMVKIPARRTTLILLANSDRLNAPFGLASGDIRRSLFATVFLRLL